MLPHPEIHRPPHQVRQRDHGEHPHEPHLPPLVPKHRLPHQRPRPPARKLHPVQRPLRNPPPPAPRPPLVHAICRERHHACHRIHANDDHPHRQSHSHLSHIIGIRSPHTHRATRELFPPPIPTPPH